MWVWSVLTLSEMRKCKFNSQDDLSELQKGLALVAYLWELVADLMLSPEANRSDQPGFESVGMLQKR